MTTTSSITVRINKVMGDEEYGLKDLEKLPLLEQVHRLYHAIQQKYPYKETNGWKKLSIERKRKMLEYIKERKFKRKRNILEKDSEKKIVENKQEEKEKKKKETRASDSLIQHNTDPYLKMLQRRNIKTQEFHESQAGLHMTSCDQSLLRTNIYVENRRWKVVDDTRDSKCACGTIHDPGSTKITLLNTISVMMSTFGDSIHPCPFTVEETKDLVGSYLRTHLGTEKKQKDDTSSSICLRKLVEVFEQEATYYGRWREFRNETKHEENELEDIEEDELAEELDLFAVSETQDILNEHLLERIKFADDRTRLMDWSHYETFARGRKINFMAQKGTPFRNWLQVGVCSRASLEFLNFVAYHNIGKLIELAIKHRTGGILQAQDTPLLAEDIKAVALSFLPVVRDPSQVLMTSSHLKNNEQHQEQQILTSTMDGNNTNASKNKPLEDPNPRPTRLKRLR